MASELTELTSISAPTSESENAHYYDLRTHVDLGSAAPDQLKIVGVPISYAAFLSTRWDAKRLAGEDVVEEGQLLGVESLSAEGIEVQVGDLVAAGSSSGASAYEAVTQALSSELRKGWYRGGDVVAFGTKYETPPIKLLLHLIHYQSQSVVDAESRDRINLVIDKLALFTLLPIMMGAELLKRCLDGAEAEEAARTLTDFDRRMVSVLASASLLRPKNRDIVQPQSFQLFWIDTERWGKALALGSGWNGEAQFLLPIDLIEEMCRENLVRLHEGLLDDDATKAEWIKLDKLIQDDPGSSAETERRRFDFGFFYPIVDRLLQQELGKHAGNDAAGAFNVYKLRFKNWLPPMPVVEEIDSRAMLWAAEASSLSTEFYLADHRVKAAKRRLLAATGPDAELSRIQMEEIADELREASSRLFDVRRRIEILKDEIGDSNFTLDLTEPGEAADGDFRIRRVRTSRTEVVYRERRWHSWMATITIRKGLFRIRVLAPRGEWRWYERRRIVEQSDAPIGINWRPMERYLEQPIPAQAYASADAKERLKRALGVTSDDNLVNGRKDVRFLSLTNSGYRDQYGYSLDRILADANEEGERAKLLLIVPMEERRSDGSIAQVGYRAIHNPVATRRSYNRPRIFLVETFRHSLLQLQGHWLGPLSHVVSLFPGERRTITLETQSTFASEQSVEQSTSQRTEVERKVDVRTQVRRDLERTEEDGKKTSWNVKASGGVNLGFASFGGGAGGGGESYKSQKSVSKDINDRVSESMQRASASNEVHFSTSSKVSVTSTSSSRQTVEIENVNKGRVVNHKFFQVLNQFRSEVHLARIRVVVEYAEEVVPGLGMSKTQVYELDQLDSMLPELLEEQRTTAIQAIRDAIDKRAKESGFSLEEALSGSPLRLGEPKTWFVNSGTYFVDTEVSPSPSTEPYVEQAREAEVAARRAETEERKARAARMLKQADVVGAGSLVLPDEVGSLALTIDKVETP